MIFAVSDLHGFPLVRFQNGLKSIGFGDSDFLYILGDVVDRHGDGGAAMLRWMMAQPNMELLMGNHEQMMLRCAHLLGHSTLESIRNIERKQLRALLHWTDNGGGVTLDGFAEIARTDPESIPDIIAYVRKAVLFDTAKVRGRNYLLTHAGLGGFYPEKKMDEYTADELLWNRPSLDDQYYEDIMTIFGHTPTIMYGHEHAGKVIRTSTWCNIDVNVPGREHTAILRLDDMKEYYI